MSEGNLFEQQAANKRRSAWLTAGFVVFTAWVGFGGDFGFYLLTRDGPPSNYHHVIPFIGLAASAIAGGIAFFSWRFGPQQVLKAAGASELVEAATPAQTQLINVVHEMAIASGLRPPKIWVIPDSDPNAFATGNDPDAAGAKVVRIRAVRHQPLVVVVDLRVRHT